MQRLCAETVKVEKRENLFECTSMGQMSAVFVACYYCSTSTRKKQKDLSK